MSIQICKASFVLYTKCGLWSKKIEHILVKHKMSQIAFTDNRKHEDGCSRGEQAFPGS